MSTTSLPSYVAPSSRAPSLTSFSSSTPLNLWNRKRGPTNSSRPSQLQAGNHVNESKKGELRLRLTTQDIEASSEAKTHRTIPRYGFKGCIQGIAELLSSSTIESVEAKIDVKLRLKEIAEGGTTTAKTCLDSVVLWKREPSNLKPAPRCPSSFQFSLHLPDTFTYGDKTHSLPPTFHVKLSGVPGFTASIDYAVTLKITKQQPSAFVKWSILNDFIHTTVSTPFAYQPRTRPSVPLPYLHFSGHPANPELLGWISFQSEVRPRWQNTANVVGDAVNAHSIKTKLHLPASRVFCVLQPIPFYVTFESSTQSLTAFLPYAPSTVAHVQPKRTTRVQLMRQSTVDVRNLTMEGVKTDIWRVDCIGEGVFKHANDGPTWSSFTGEITVDETVDISGFKAPGLSVKDWIVFSVATGDSHRAAFDELRQVVPVRLTTDPWADAPDQEIMVVGPLE